MALRDGVKMINQILASSKTSAADRMIVCETTETLLREAGSYFGSRLLYPYEIPEGELPGKYPDKANRGRTDATRREYFVEPSTNRDR